MKHLQIGWKLILIASASAYLILTGLDSSIVYRGKPGTDFAVFYNAGSLLLDHVNPYLLNAPTQALPVELSKRRPYAYPPQFSSIIIGFAMLPYSTARSLFDVLNLVAIATLTWGTTLFLWPARRLGTAIAVKDTQSTAGITNWHRHWWIICVILLIQPFTSHTLWGGQTTIWIFALLVFGWWYEMHHRWLPGGVLFGIVTCNPPLAILPIVWLLCDRRFKTLVVGLATALVMSIPAFYVLGPTNAFQSWYNALLSYRVSNTNVPDATEMFGIRTLLAAAGVPMVDLTIIGVVFAVVIWFFRSHLTDAEALALLVIGGLLTVHAHTYSLVGLIVAVPVLCRHMDLRRWVIPLALWLGALIMVPRRLLRMWEVPDFLLQWRVLLVVGLSLLIITLVVLREHDETTSNPSG